MKKAQKKAVALGAGVAAVAAAATAAYFLTGKNAKNRAKLAKWAKDMQTDVVKEIKKAGNLTKSSYVKTVDEVAKKYKQLKKANAPELAKLATELKNHWDAINREVVAATKEVKRIIPKSAKSSANKVKVNGLITKKQTAKKTSKKVAKKTAKRD
jgi:vacuolar-type H+-ATPase subunit I/STV1